MVAGSRDARPNTCWRHDIHAGQQGDEMNEDQHRHRRRPRCHLRNVLITLKRGVLAGSRRSGLIRRQDIAVIGAAGVDALAPLVTLAAQLDAATSAIAANHKSTRKHGGIEPEANQAEPSEKHF